MPRLPTPEEVLRDRDAPALALSLSCTRCGAVTNERFDWAFVHPDLEACRAQGWDGVTLSRMVCCAKCGAIDAYALAGRSHQVLTAGVLAATIEELPGRVILAESRLWDGTQVRRPSQALARLRELAAEHPKSVEALLRLGNGCERFGLLDESLAAWRRAVELDEHALEPLWFLAQRLLRSEATAREGFSFLRRAVSAIPSARSLDKDTLRALTHNVFEALREYPAHGQPLALMAGWRDGGSDKQPVVHMSSVDLRDVLSVWDRLVDFAASPSVLGLELTNELPDDPAPQLLRLLVHGEKAPVPARQTPSVAAAKTGRNEPCPCGSGKKFKRCCG